MIAAADDQLADLVTAAAAEHVHAIILAHITSPSVQPLVQRCMAAVSSPRSGGARPVALVDLLALHGLDRTCATG